MYRHIYTFLNKNNLTGTGVTRQQRSRQVAVYTLQEAVYNGRCTGGGVQEAVYRGRCTEGGVQEVV